MDYTRKLYLPGINETGPQWPAEVYMEPNYHHDNGINGNVSYYDNDFPAQYPTGWWHVI